MINILFGIPGVNCAVIGCGSCRRTKGIGILSSPLFTLIVSTIPLLDFHNNCWLYKSARYFVYLEQCFFDAL